MPDFFKGLSPEDEELETLLTKPSVRKFLKMIDDKSFVESLDVEGVRALRETLAGISEALEGRSPATLFQDPETENSGAPFNAARAALKDAARDPDVRALLDFFKDKDKVVLVNPLTRSSMKLDLMLALIQADKACLEKIGEHLNDMRDKLCMSSEDGKRQAGDALKKFRIKR